MPYIDADYYNNIYLGADAGSDLDRYISRASDLIDQVIGYKLARTPFEEQPTFVQDQIKKATAAQVEFYVMQGGDQDVNAGTQEVGSVRIGSFQYNAGEPSKNKQPNRVSPAVLEYLAPTGLLYTGLDVIQNAYYTSDS